MEAGNKIRSLIFFIGLILTACVKDPQDIPAGLTNDPVFSLSGILDGQTLNIKAGENDWTMQPAVETADSIAVYTSLFSLDGCLDQCKPSWSFRFYQSNQGSGTIESEFLKTIQSGSKEYVQSPEETDSFNVLLRTDPGLFMSGYSSWENLDGPSTSFTVEYRDVFGFNEFLNVCFQSLAYTGCQYIQCIYFNPATEVPCLISLQPKIEDSRTVSLAVSVDSGTPPFQYEWFDGHTSASIVLPLQNNQNEIYAGVKVTDALGNQAELNQTIRLQNGIVDACYFPISLMSTQVTSSDSYADRVEIIFTDQDGDEWKSTAGVQGANSFMQISQVEYYDLSPLQEPAFKVGLSFSVDLFNVMTGESKSFQSQSSTIALSHQ